MYFLVMRQNTVIACYAQRGYINASAEDLEGYPLVARSGRTRLKKDKLCTPGVIGFGQVYCCSCWRLAAVVRHVQRANEPNISPGLSVNCNNHSNTNWIWNRVCKWAAGESAVTTPREKPKQAMRKAALRPLFANSDALCVTNRDLTA